jgi:membrane fusion protein (multidrug efflux system)
MYALNFHKTVFKSVSILFLFLLFSGCGLKKAEEQAAVNPPSLPVVLIEKKDVAIYNEYPASIEGKVNIDLRPQVEGYLEKIFVDEGAYVKAGQPLFKISDKVYREQLNTATANLHIAEASVKNAQIEVDKITTLYANKVVSDFQLRTVKVAYESAEAMVEQARTMVAAARINLDFTLIKAPVSGYIGRMPKRIGSLVSSTDPVALTTLSDIHEVYIYFTMSESAFLKFNGQGNGKTLQQRINSFHPVSLKLANGEVYAHKGKIEVVAGQADKSTGGISLRATFPNTEGLLRSGNTGKIIIREQFDNVSTVPIAATLDIQNKTFVYVLKDSNKVAMQPIVIKGKNETFYFVSEGLEPNTSIVVSGIETIQDGSVIVPKRNSLQK